jgi:hypothetical protein
MTLLRELDVVKAFLLFALGSVVGGFIAGALAGMIWGVLIATTSGNLADVQRGAAILGGVAGFIMSFFIFRVVTLKFIAPRVVSSANQTSAAGVV